MNGYEGWAALGEALGGGNRQSQADAYYKGARESATTFDALAKARISRAQANARESLPQALRDAQIQHPDLAASILGMATGQPNLGTYTDGLKDLGDIELERQQLAALGEGNFAHANQLNAVKTDKAYEPVRELGGSLVPSGVALGDPAFEVKPLPQTQATVDLREAQRTRALRPPAARASGSNGKAPTTAQVEARELADAREALQSGIPRATVIAKMRARGYGNLAKKL